MYIMERNCEDTARKNWGEGKSTGLLIKKTKIHTKSVFSVVEGWSEMTDKVPKKIQSKCLCRCVSQQMQRHTHAKDSKHIIFLYSQDIIMFRFLLYTPTTVPLCKCAFSTDGCFSLPRHSSYSTCSHPHSVKEVSWVSPGRKSTHLSLPVLSLHCH